MKRNLLIGAGLLALCLAGCDGPVTLNSSQMRNAKLAGTEFSMNMQADFVGCSGLDSEPDGYVSCTIKDRSTRATSSILCSYGEDSGGCKIK